MIVILITPNPASCAKWKGFAHMQFRPFVFSRRCEDWHNNVPQDHMFQIHDLYIWAMSSELISVWLMQFCGSVLSYKTICVKFIDFTHMQYEPIHNDICIRNTIWLKCVSSTHVLYGRRHTSKVRAALQFSTHKVKADMRSVHPQSEGLTHKPSPTSSRRVLQVCT